MKVELTDVSETKKTLTVEVPPEVVDIEISRVTQGYARQARIPGFRPGKAPVHVVRKRFREQILHDVAHDLVPRVVGDALRDKNVQPVDGDYAIGLGIHEMGTARMGRDPKTSVLNAHNQVHECKNVYVTDGAAMTSASCVNPSLTYMALTARAADHAVTARKRGEL